MGIEILDVEIFGKEVNTHYCVPGTTSGYLQSCCVLQARCLMDVRKRKKK